MRAFVLRLSSFVFAGLLVCWLTLLPPQAQTVDVGGEGADWTYLRGAYQRETAGDTTFRWVGGDATLTLPTGNGGTTLLEARLHGAPDLRGGTLPLTMTLGTGGVLHLDIPEGERVYRLPVPTSADGSLHVQIDGATVIPPGDDRKIAFALDRFGARPIDATTRPAWLLVAQQGLLIGATLALLMVFGVSVVWQFAAGVLLVAALGSLNLMLRLWITTATLPFALSVFALAILAGSIRFFGARQHAQNDLSFGTFGLFSPANARLLWAIMIGGAALRLLGVLAPGFEAHDLDIQSEQFAQVATGLLYFTVHSHEWAGAATFYPPGPYVLLLPLRTLLPSVATTLHVGAALADAVGPLLLALIARRLGASQRAALLAALLLAGLPIQFTALWWGFFTNVIGQTLVLLLVWTLLQYVHAPSRRRLALVALVATQVLLSHAGVLAQAGVLVVLVLAYVWIDERRRTKDESQKARHLRPSPFVLRHLSLTLFCVGLAVGLLYFSVIVIPMIIQALTIADTRATRDPARSAAFRAYIIAIQPAKWWRGLLGLPALLLVPGLMLLWQRTNSSLGRALLLVWPLVPVLFFIAELIFLVQVRYVYFAAPICVLALAVWLDCLRPSRAGRIVLWSIVLMIVITGSALWLDGSFLGDKPSLVPLTH